MSETKKPKKPSEKRIVDVHEPGTSAPSATSKPVIVTNRPLLRDPMVLGKTDSEDEEDEKPETAPATALLATGEARLEPLDDSLDENKNSEPEEKPDPTPREETELAATPDDETKAADDADSADIAAPESIPSEEPADAIDTENLPPANQADQPEPAGSDQPARPDDQVAAIDSGTPSRGTAKQADAQAIEQAKHDAEIQKLIDSEQYVLPINTVERRKSKRFVILGISLAVILVIIWLDIALDADIIRLGGLKSITHFFSN